MTVPKLSKEEALELVKKSGKTFPESIFILGIRGYYKDSMGKPGENDRGIYDDALFLIGPNTYVPVNANTDPSKFKPGIASLVPGLYYYKRDYHHKFDPKKRYPAFRPATPDESVPVTRDGQEGVSKGIAINIHKGSYNSTSSEGCQTIYPDEWLNFQQTAYKIMDQEGQHLIPYLLIVQ